MGAASLPARQAGLDGTTLKKMESETLDLTSKLTMKTPSYLIGTSALLAVGLFITLDTARGASKEAPPAKDEKTLWVAPSRAARKDNPLAASQNSIAQGKTLFTTACCPCHGPEGRGDGPAAASLERNGARIRPGNLSDPKMWLQSDGAIFWKITEGNSPMPTFGPTFTEEQRWQIVNYVRTLAPRTTAANKTSINRQPAGPQP